MLTYTCRLAPALPCAGRSGDIMIKATPRAAALTLGTLVLIAGCTGGGGSGDTNSPSGTGGPSADRTSAGAGATAGPSSGPAAASPGTTTPTAKKPGAGAPSPRGSLTQKPVEVPVGGAADPCTITGAAEVTRAFGGTVVTETPGMSGTGNATCRFLVNRTDVGTAVTVQMSLTKHVSGKVFAQVKKQHGNQSIGGVGDDAFYRPSTKTVQTRVRDTTVAIAAVPGRSSLTAAQRATLRADLIALGRTIAASL